MDEKTIERIIEAFLFASDKPLSLDRIKETLEDVDEETIKNAIAGLKSYYSSQNLSFTIAEVAGGYQLTTHPDYKVWVNKLYKKPKDKLRGPSMETLAIVVYRQPITKGEIEAIRGVNVDGVLKTLMERNLIRIKGRKDSPGRPLLYATTDEFLERFGLKDLKSLPPLKEFRESDLDFERYRESQEIDLSGESRPDRSEKSEVDNESKNVEA